MASDVDKSWGPLDSFDDGTTSKLRNCLIKIYVEKVNYICFCFPSSLPAY